MCCRPTEVHEDKGLCHGDALTRDIVLVWVGPLRQGSSQRQSATGRGDAEHWLRSSECRGTETSLDKLAKNRWSQDIRGQDLALLCLLLSVALKVK